MSKKSKWTRIIVARVLEGLLTAAAFGVGLWHTVKSARLEEELDEKLEDEEEVDDET